MRKYELRRPKKSDGWMVMFGYDEIIVSKKELKKYINNEWEFVRERYFIVTNLLDWLKTLNNGNRIALFGIIFTGFISIFLWCLSQFFEHKKQNLKTENSLIKKRFDSLKKSDDSLTVNFELLNQRFHSLKKDLNEKNKIIESLKLKIKSKNTSDKK